MKQLLLRRLGGIITMPLAIIGNLLCRLARKGSIRRIIIKVLSLENNPIQETVINLNSKGFPI